MAKTATEIIEELNITDEHAGLEAKAGFGKSLWETICAFANEPAMGGGTIILGVSADQPDLFARYSVTGVDNPDQISADIASQCASVFNTPQRPAIRTETVNDKPVLIIDVAEAAPSEKPVYIKSRGLPKGAFRRIGSTDQQCTEEDIAALFSEGTYESYDNHIIPDADMEDLDPQAIEDYRKLRTRVYPGAEEVQMDDEDMLKSLAAIRKNRDGQWKPTLTGILLFGSRQALRRLVPSVRIDYIRLPGKEWIEDPDNRYVVQEMRGPLLQLVQRAREAIYDDLPKAFNLPEGEIQAQYTNLPVRALREAIVNAVMHASYRSHQPIQIRRYTNRIEIFNPGYSLKNEENLGEPGSQLRNPKLAAVFHDTNLAEQKGSGIKTMRRLMEEADFAPPTFESSRQNNSFTARFLLHHFLNDEDLQWLQNFASFDLNQEQRKGLIFLRENGAIDNSTYRQLNGLDVMTASNDLRRMRDLGLLEMKERGKAAHYLPGAEFDKLSNISAPYGLGENESELGENESKLGENTTPLGEKVAQLLPEHLIQTLQNMPKRASQSERERLILDICKHGEWTAMELASLIKLKDHKYLKRTYLQPLIEKGKIEYSFPDMPNHPKQAYKKSNKDQDG